MFQCVLIMVSLFRVETPASKLGMMLASYSPAMPTALAYGVLMDANINLMAALIAASMLSALCKSSM